MLGQSSYDCYEPLPHAREVERSAAFGRGNITAMVLVLDNSIELDEGLFELRRDGASVSLEPQAFDVLLYLIRHRDRVVAKEELMDEVWGGRFVSETAVTSRIKQVRRALGDDGQAQRLVRTLHGRGYRFVAEVTDTTLTEPAAASVPCPCARHHDVATRTRPDPLHHQRRPAHRLSGHRWGRHRHRADLGVRVPPRPRLGRPPARPLPGAARLDGTVDPFRQARHRHVGSPPGRAGPGAPHARRARGYGCGRLGASRRVRLLRGWPDGPDAGSHAPRTGAVAGPLRHLRPPHLGRGLPLGTDPGGARGLHRPARDQVGLGGGPADALPLR